MRFFTLAGGNPPANSQTFNMYSDDDPGVTLDYDFKDLNQINRATGETVSWILKPKFAL